MSTRMGITPRMTARTRQPQRRERGGAMPAFAAALAVLFATACGRGGSAGPDRGAIELNPVRPDISDGVDVAPYSGTNTLVQQAQATYRNGMDLQRKLILRSCGPNEGVCHNQKEYPDMHTAASFAATIGAPCNVQPGTWSTVFDRCERRGDRFRFEASTHGQVEVAWVDYVLGEGPDYTDTSKPNETSPGLHVVLAEPVPGTRASIWDTGQFIRTFISPSGSIEEIAFTSYRTEWWILEDRRHLVAEVRNYQVDDVQQLLKAGIIQGDHNRNGTFGHGDPANRPVVMLNPGKPEESYLVGRLRGHVQGQLVPGSRMPLANAPPSVPDMLALMCFIEGLSDSPDRWSLWNGIDYNSCSYSADPAGLNLVGSGASWKGRIRPLLEANCGGCHSSPEPEQGLDLTQPVVEGQPDPVHAYLMGRSTQRTDLNLVQPGNTVKSYLWLKLSGDGSIIGERMPVDPLGGVRVLQQQELDDIATWINYGALAE